MKKVSIIVPVYNVEKYLKRCLDSLLHQTFANSEYEIICVNDCSHDHSQEILDEYVERYPDRIKVLINLKNMGLGLTRDRAIAEANGKYILFVDSDDYVKKDYIEKYYEQAVKEKVDVVIGGYIKDLNGKYITHKEFSGIWALVSYTIACAKMYRREFILDNDLRFMGHRCGEDIFFNLNVFLAHPKIKVIDYAGYYYFFNPKSITSSVNADKNIEVMIDEMFDRLLENHPIQTISEKDRKVLEYVYVTHIANSMIQYNRGCGWKKMKSKYVFCFEHLKNKFPLYKENSFFGFKKPNGQSMKIRYAVATMMYLHKIHLDKAFFFLLSISPF